MPINLIPPQALPAAPDPNAAAVAQMLSSGFGTKPQGSVYDSFVKSQVLAGITKALMQRAGQGAGIDQGGPQVPWDNPYGYSSGV